MMRFLICVCLAGAGAYFLFPTSEEPEWGTGAKLATAKPEPLPLGDRKLRSWGSTLQSLGRDSQGRTAVSRQSGTSSPPRQQAAYWPGDPKHASERTPGAGVAPGAQVEAPAQATNTAAEHVSWAKVILPARAHSAASVSSPVTKFYPPGTELQIVGRESAWLELQDPVTQERGFVFEKYLVATDGPSPTKSVTQASAVPAPPKVASKVASPKAQTPRQASRSLRQAANDVEVTRPDEVAPDRRRVAKKEERRERKLFRWFGGRDPAPLTVGSPR